MSGSSATRWLHDFDDPPSGSADDRLRLLGGKGANLAVMAHELDLPVPPGFTITTGACAAFRSGGWPEGLDNELREAMDRLSARLGRRFGDASDPLVVSVRSGAPVSMPGMMDTILDLGLNDASVAGLATTSGDPSFADECLRRFRASWSEVIGGEPPEDPWAQLRAAIEAVFRSWDGDRARAYRRREGIPDDLGTAVTVQAMVFGNLDDRSATGVLFTRNPASGARESYGDVLFRAQGEDVVAGTHEPEPIAALSSRLPHVAEELRGVADRLERHYADLCDIEFTVERGRLWLLQVRAGKRSPVAALRMAIEMAEDPSFPLTRDAAVRRVAPLLADPPTTFVPEGTMPEPATRGLGASPGIASGAIVTSSDAAEAEADAGHAVILVRSETSPDDVRGMARSAGILTARGGLASHAAVVARGWGIPAVVGAADVDLDGPGIRIRDTHYPSGTELTIDGDAGAVYIGVVAGRHEIVPEADVLRGWGEALGMRVISGTDPAPDGTAAAGSQLSGGEATGDDVVRALAVRGTISVEALADGLLAARAAVEAAVEALRSDGSVDGARDALRLTAAGRDRAAALVDADRERLGADRAAEAIEDFAAYDGRMKAIVTAWQIRDVNGQQALNDHADEAYDAAVLADLGTLHARVMPWLEPLGAAVPRYVTYRERLARAAERALAGDGRWIASPRVDSYHSVWFELHEDLIRLAGRTREEEAAAGRA